MVADTKMIPSLAEQGRGQGQASVWNMHPAPRASPARTHSSLSITECRHQHFTNVDLSWWALCRICRCKLQVALGMEEIDLLLLQNCSNVQSLRVQDHLHHLRSFQLMILTMREDLWMILVMMTP